jgi:hypothetical protein
MTDHTRQPRRRCGDHEHQWTEPGEFATVICRRCRLTLRQSFAATERQIAQLPVTGGPDRPGF